MKKVLIITYYWIPSGGSGVQRWVKFVKYLRSFGWEPIVYAPENPDYPLIDKSFADDIPTDVEVIKHKIWEPYQLYRKFTGNKSKAIQTGFVVEKKQLRWKDKFSIWLRGNLFIPDARIFWVRPSIRFLKKYLKNNPVDIIVTTGPPHSVHLIGQGLKHEFPNIPWVADFRDPWTSIFYYKDLKLTHLADKIHQGMEKEIISSADAVVVVSEHMKKEYEMFKNKRIEIISNGYDETDFEDIEPYELERKFVITYTGLMTDKQNPKVLWKVLSELAVEIDGFENDLLIRLVGGVDNEIIDDLKAYGLESNAEILNYVSHSEVIRFQKSSQILLLSLMNDTKTKSVVTGKLFEYLKANRPVIGIGFKDGDAAALLQQTGAGEMFDFEDFHLLKMKLLSYYQQFNKGILVTDTDEKTIAKFSRQTLTGTLAKLMEGLI
ncbi:glycosyltransferase family 4 protein [Paludibacter sp.]